MSFGLIVLNVATFALVLIDKLFAQWRVRRIPELVFYVSGFLGGSIGVLLGMFAFRHKTRKTSFQFVLGMLILIQLLLVWWLTEKELLKFG